MCYNSFHAKNLRRVHKCCIYVIDVSPPLLRNVLVFHIGAAVFFAHASRLATALVPTKHAARRVVRQIRVERNSRILPLLRTLPSRPTIIAWILNACSSHAQSSHPFLVLTFSRQDGAKLRGRGSCKGHKKWVTDIFYCPCMELVAAH